MDMDEKICPVPDTWAALANLRGFFSLQYIVKQMYKSKWEIEYKNYLPYLSPPLFKSWGEEQPKWWTKIDHKIWRNRIWTWSSKVGELEPCQKVLRNIF